MTATPDALPSIEDLKELLASAQTEESVTKPEWQIRKEANEDNKEAVYNGMTEKELIDYVEYSVDRTCEEQPHVVGAKFLALKYIRALTKYCEEYAEFCLENDNPQAAGLWMKDCGRLWIAIDALRDTNVHQDDFFANGEDD